MGRLHTTKDAWYQVRLRPMLLAIGLIGIGLALWSEFVRPYQRQALVVSRIKAAGGTVETRGGPLWLQRIAGADNVQDITLVDLSDADPSPELLAAIHELPRLEVLILGGDNITEESVPQLPPCKTLQAAIFDSTYLSLAKLDEFRAARPGVFVGRCDRRTMRELFADGPQSTVSSWVRKPITAPPAALQARIEPDMSAARQSTLQTGGSYFDEVVQLDLRRLGNRERLVLPKLLRLQALGLESLQDVSANPLSAEELQQLIEQLRPVFSRLKGLGPGRMDQQWHEVLAAMPDLESIYYSTSENQITDGDLQQLWATQPRLKSLTIPWSYVADPQTWPPFPLEHLNVHNTALDDGDLAVLAQKYPQLQTLNLENTWITDAGVAKLAPLHELEELRLARTRATDASYGTLRSFPKLQRISIGRDRNTDAAAGWDQSLDVDSAMHDFIADLNRAAPERTAETRARLALGKFKVSPRKPVPNEIILNPLESLNLEAVLVMPDITSVRADLTYVDDAGLRELVRAFPNVEKLSLVETWVTDDGLAELAALKKLTSLDLRGTRMTKRGLARLADVQLLRELIFRVNMDSECFDTLLRFPSLESAELYFDSQRSPRFSVAEMQRSKALINSLMGKRLAYGSSIVGVGFSAPGIFHIRSNWVSEFGVQPVQSVGDLLRAGAAFPPGPVKAKPVPAATNGQLP